MNDRMIVERIEANLDRLKLPRIREVLDAATQVAMDEQKSYLTYLGELLEEEVAQKEQRRVDTALKIK